ncbi:SDR family oxidoreductase [Roseateles chitosanitabidus]|uniref:SDR family oxidoreductase n=1 Tax=Roseateles chitosanitabidus TaxID=65048 RepID=UPI000831C6A3|nr:SDR family oxidoreductase [Roseateles chitosanitabidus]
MRVFVTGATGFVGSAVVRELLSAGHTVLGLARSDASAAALAATGATVRRGSIDDLDGLRAGASDCDAVIHTAFDHDFSRFAENCRRDRIAIEALGEALRGSDRPLIATSGLALSPSIGAREADERDEALPTSENYPRASEPAALALAAAGVNAAVVRLPPTVHGLGDHGFVPMLMDLARRTGVSAMVGEGANLWSAVHREDAAVVYRRAIESPITGARWHAIAEERIPFKAIAAAIGTRLGLPVQGLTPEEAQAHFGWLAKFAGLRLAASSAWTRETLGWAAAGPTLGDDLADARYAAITSAA